MKLFAVLLVSALFLGTGASYAQENDNPDAASGEAGAEEIKDGDSYILEEIAVSATRTETASEKAPASVTVITADDIRKKNAATVDELLRNEAGIVVSRNKGLASSVLNISMRGLGTGDRNLVMLDGIPLNDGYTGDVPWTQLGLDNIERIEITRGPGSALYGGNAMGGVVNIVTKKPGKIEGSAKIGAGNEDTGKLSASFGGMLSEHIGLRVGGEYEKTGGYVTSLLTKSPSGTSSGGQAVTGGYENTTRTGGKNWVIGDSGKNWGERMNVNLQAFFIPEDTSSIVFGVQHGEFKYGYSEPDSYIKDASGRTVMEGTIDLGDGRYVNITPSSFVSGGIGKESYTNLSLGYDKEFSFMEIGAKLNYNFLNKWYTTASVSGVPDATYDNAPGNFSDADTDTWYAEVQASAGIGSFNKLTGGVAFKANSYDAAEYGLSFFRNENSKTSKTTTTVGKDFHAGIFLQDEMTLPAGFTVFAGLRYDLWKAYDGRSGNVGREETHSEPFGNAFSPKIALVWNYFKNTYVRTSFGMGFRPPNIYELYRTWVSASGVTYHSNPDLKPETVMSYEIGLDQFFFDRRWKISGTYYFSELTDAIDRVSAGTDRYYDNVGKVHVNGVELSTEIIPVKNLNIWSNFTWTDSEIRKNTNNPSLVGKKLTDVPEMVFNVGASYTWNILTFAFDGNYLGRMYYDSDNGDKDDIYTGYSKRWLWNAKLMAAFNEHVELALSVNNIFNEEYYNYYIGQGRTYMVELTGRF